MKRLLAVLTIVALSSLAWSSDAQAGFVIDDFSTTNAPVDASDATANGSAVTSSGLAGGSGLPDLSREFYANKTAPAGSSLVTLNSNNGLSIGDPGLLTFDQSSGTTEGFAHIVYDGVGSTGDPDAPSFTTMSVNLVAGGNNAFVFNGFDTDGMGLDFFVTLWDSTGLSATVGRPDLADGFLGNLTLLFSEFTTITPALNLTSIGAIVVGVDARATTVLGPGAAAAGNDLRFDQLQVTGVPEPATFAIWSVLCVGLGFVRRRR
jgi:hypothetical protein